MARISSSASRPCVQRTQSARLVGSLPQELSAAAVAPGHAAASVSCIASSAPWILAAVAGSDGSVMPLPVPPPRQSVSPDPESLPTASRSRQPAIAFVTVERYLPLALPMARRSEEHTSELQSLRHLVCR